MASPTGRKTTALMERLETQPRDFSLSQALRLLYLLHVAEEPDQVPNLRRMVRIRPWLSLSFPSCELTEARREEGIHILTATGLGLYSTLGPLPTFYTEELLEEARQDESVTRDFLDMLNNHLLHSLVRAQAHYREARRIVEERDAAAALIPFCLMGQGYASLRPEGLPQVAVLELLLRRTRSASGLEAYLSHVLNWSQITVEQCVQRVVPIPESQRCRIGLENACLGEDAVAGQELLDVTGKFRVHIRGLSEARLQSFLPGTSGCRALAAHIRRYLDQPLQFDVFLYPEQVSPPPHILGHDLRIGCYLAAPGFIPKAPVAVYFFRRRSSGFCFYIG